MEFEILIYEDTNIRNERFKVSIYEYYIQRL